ncbi:MAG TPA: aminotransferase class I/II-fold pyridoxal phosphate-dependent enzyme, partial [Acidimicrobiales bacterium]
MTRTGPAADPPAGFAPPPYPYERLNGARARATERFAGSGGPVDCSIGTPCDAPPDTVLAAMATSGTERGYPTSPGSLAYRRAAAGWMARRFGGTEDPDGEVAACVGTKEFVATTAQFLRLRTPGRDTVLYPSVSYPTYAMGATLAGARAVPGAEAAGGGLDLDAVDPADA